MGEGEQGWKHRNDLEIRLNREKNNDRMLRRWGKKGGRMGDWRGHRDSTDAVAVVKSVF